MGKKVNEDQKNQPGEEVSLEDIKSERPDYEDLLPLMNEISKPLASKKMTKRLFKCIKKSKSKKMLSSGVKDVVRRIRKKEKGFVVLAGDVSPIDIYSHLPVYCEENKIPYCFVPSRFDLGLACQTKRPTVVVLVKKDEDYEELYTELKEKIKEMPLPI